MPARLIPVTWQHDPTLDAPPKYRRACRYEAYVPAPLTELSLQLSGELAGLVAEAERGIRELNAEAKPALTPLARLLLRTESIASSRVEGLQMGTRELARAEAKLEQGKHAGSTALEIIDNIKAMQIAVDEASAVDRFGVDDITTIHRHLMERARPRLAGRIRTVQNWIGGNDHNPCGADFVPPPPDYVVPLLEDLCVAIEDDLLPPLVQAALVHAQFETIHPFDDGNGRTGRALIYVTLRRRGVATEYVPPISVVLARGRDRYISALTAYRSDRVTDWIEHFAAAAASAATLATRYLHAVQALIEQWKSQVIAATEKAPRTDAAVWKLIQELPAHPFITGPVAAAVTRRSKPQANQAIDQLVKAGVLLPRSAGKRNQTWEAAGLLELIAGLEEGEMPPA